MTFKRKGPPRDKRGRFVKRKPAGPPRDKRGRFVSRKELGTEYSREIEQLRRDLDRLKREGKAREADIERNYKRRGGAYDRYVEILALGQRKKIDDYLNSVYDGNMSKDDFVTMAVNVGLTVREAWAVLYS